ATRFAANVQGLPEAVADADAAAAERALASVAAVNEDLDVIAAVSPDGRSLATLSRTADGITPHAGERWADAPPVRAVLAGVADGGGDKHAGLLRLVDGSAVLVVAAPVRVDNALVGSVVVGRRAGKIVDEAARRSGTVVALYDGSQARIASSDNSVRARVSPVAVGESRRERDVTGEAEVGRLVTGLDVRDRRVGTLSVTVPLGSAFDAVRQTAIRLGLLVALGLAAIVAIGALLSRNILQTVRPLLATNRALGRGELGARAPVLGNDELGELAEGFNQMAGQLEASYQQLERRVAERTEELQRLYRAREEFFASVSHELRTPLFAILANSELLTDPMLAPDNPKEQAEFLDTIHVSAQQLVTNVNDILDLARADATAVRLNLADVDVRTVLEEVTASVQALGRRDDVEVTLRLPAGVPTLIADRERFVQILLNLGSNAVKYTPSGGRVTISARAVGDTVEIDVADTGAGIAADVGDRVFEPYYVVAGAGQHGHPSTGLGLAVTKRLVDAHGGTISYTSRPTGTTFTVRLPCTAPAAPTPTNPSPNPAGGVRIQ
ncbi:MAG TPA: HAMP domain-containing sensor histidine kinase, partial [Acidimicrobiales bacterium]|nr:HAMP domain-containing sensor histidine kinase [Acidimicrobiales bacterium]